ncbi:MAG: hypothetical protein QOI35_1941, partial [Cryptosporangiaceae bacterium]|nr:hypothetical protein [Cryptosporangiaceae bacterium]
MSADPGSAALAREPAGELPLGELGAGAKVRKPAKKAARRGAQVAAAELPVAHVCVDLPLPHLDRPFDYLVPASADTQVVTGSRVRVRFAGQLVDGYVLGRSAESGHTGRLAFLDRALSGESVLSPEIAAAAREIAARTAGTLADVLRLAIPPRHARAEAKPWPEAAESPADPRPEHWARYPAGGA